MRIKTDLTTGSGSTLKGGLKLTGFMLLVGGFVPAHFLLKPFKRIDPAFMPRLFHRALSRLVGFRIHVHGEMVSEAPDKRIPTLFVSNHSSYLDIPVLGSIIPGCFVAKSEVASWPFIGTMARLQNTVFIERRAARAAVQKNVLRDRLEMGQNLILFPEGTSSDGHRTLPFKSSLFSIVENPLPNDMLPIVQPVSIVATRIGGLPMGRAWRHYYAWYAEMTLIKHVWEFFKIGAFTVDVVFHPPVSMADFTSRKLMAEYCERAVARGVDQCVTGRFEEDLAA